MLINICIILLAFGIVGNVYFINKLFDELIFVLKCIRLHHDEIKDLTKHLNQLNSELNIQQTDITLLQSQMSTNHETKPITPDPSFTESLCSSAFCARPNPIE